MSLPSTKELLLQQLLDFNLLRRAYLRRYFPAGLGLDSKINFVDFSILTLVKSAQFQSTTAAAKEIGISQSFCSRALSALNARRLVKRGASAGAPALTRNGEKQLSDAIAVNSSGYRKLLQENLGNKAAAEMLEAFKELALGFDAQLPGILQHFKAGQHDELVLNSIARSFKAFGNYAFGSTLTFLELQLLNALLHAPFETLPVNKLSSILACRSTAAVAAAQALKKKGALAAAPLAFDKKNVFLKISSQGRDAYGKALLSGAGLLPGSPEKYAEFLARFAPWIEQMRKKLPEKILGTDPLIMQRSPDGSGHGYRFLIVPEYFIWPGIDHPLETVSYIDVSEVDKGMTVSGRFDRAQMPAIQKILRALN